MLEPEERRGALLAAVLEWHRRSQGRDDPLEIVDDIAHEFGFEPDELLREIERLLSAI